MKSNKNIVFGLHPIIEAIKAGKDIDKVLIQKNAKGPLLSELFGLIKERGISTNSVPVEKLNRLVRGNHQGAIAFISPVTFYQLENLLPQIYERGEVPLFLMLDRVSDVRNFGAIVRTAACAGVHAVIIPQKGGAQISEDAIKTSAGALFKIPVCKEKTLLNTLKYLQDSGIQIVACTEKGNDSLYQIDYTTPTALIMGSEEDGVSSDLLKKSDYLAKIPMTQIVSSLNVSVAAGVFLFEVGRQRSIVG